MHYRNSTTNFNYHTATPSPLAEINRGAGHRKTNASTPCAITAGSATRHSRHSPSRAALPFLIPSLRAIFRAFLSFVIDAISEIVVPAILSLYLPSVFLCNYISIRAALRVHRERSATSDFNSNRLVIQWSLRGTGECEMKQNASKAVLHYAYFLTLEENVGGCVYLEWILSFFESRLSPIDRQIAPCMYHESSHI